MAYCTKNTLFVRNLSPQVSEAVLRETFGKCDVVERVLFRSYPGRATEYFAQIDFRTSAGVTEGHKLSGTSILGVTCEVSVMDPGSKAMMKQVWERREQQLLPPGEEAPHPSEPQGVQAEYIRRFKEVAEDKRLRTVHIAGLTEEASEEGLRILLKSFGDVEALRLDVDEEGKRFALVEFQDRKVAYACKTHQQFLVDGNVLVFTEAKTLVDTKSFAEQSVHFTTPIFDASTMRAVLAYQCHLNPKLAKARAAAAEIMNEPVPPETEAILKQAEEATQEPEPVQWPGRSEKDVTQWPWRPTTPAKDRSRHRSSRSREQKRQHEGGRRRRRSRVGRRRHRGAEGGRRRAREAQEQAGGGNDAIDLDDPEVAMVPNTEMLVLGESSSYSEFSQSPAREGKQTAAPMEPPPALEPECHEIPSLPSPARSIADSLAEEAEESSGMADVAGGEAIEEAESVAQFVPPGCGAAALASAEASQAGQAAETPAVGGVQRAESRSGDGAAAPDGESEARAATSGGARAELSDAPRAEGATAEVDCLTLGGSRASSSRARPDLTPSRWECSKCGEVNKPSRTQCNNCSMNAPWVKEEEPVEDVDARSTTSEASPSPVRSLGDTPPSPARSVADSPARSVSVAASGSARSVVDSPRSPARSVGSSAGAGGDLVDLAEIASDKGDEECQWEADRVRGEVADARARIFHDDDS
uniref:RanBP2-type domain-containing protein n=1 Tax=Pyrodinium bahamense TaxID=73915 RepID=A0A7S0FP89_9DINO|mmetsp:Transcript_40749/g.113256  ORF Transcript_40749/g.113256 Transcript_40749/m.113256 type:complete len:700 (+) Transcript_40749:99-2198(+)